MMWVDYNIFQAGENFRVEGDWPGEVMGLKDNGTPKESCLYKPGDVFVVNESGWLIKQPSEVEKFVVHKKKVNTRKEEK
tara:strand:- start:336 stop:572 length:237 start_codon:yes stop_codon:yes gene_type:complete